MDWDRLITVEQMEAATNELLETGKKVGADSWQQRVKNQTPHCGFGEAGTCCRICSMGPCRITPKAPRGICGCDVQQTFCWQPDMCITDACEAEYRALLDAEVRVLAAAPGERFSIIEICTDRLFLGDAFSQCAAGYCSPREYRRLFRAG